MASAPDQTASPQTLEHVAGRAMELCRQAEAENERLREQLAAVEAKRRKAVAQARKAIPMLRQSQAKLKSALAANAALDRQVAAALSHARTMEKRAETAEAHAQAADGKAAIEGRLKRLRGGRRRRAA